MEDVAGNVLCEHFEANMVTQSCCQNCFYPEEAHGARRQVPRSPSSAEVPYCDVPCCPPVPEDPLSTSTCACQSAVGPGLRQGPERGLSPTAGLPEEGPKAPPGSRHRDLEAVPYLEGLAPSPCGSCCKGPDSDTSSSPDSNTPDDTSTSSSADWDTVEKWAEVPSWDQLVMIPQRPQEGPRADSARRATRSPARGDTAQRKDDSGGGSHSAGQHWAKLRGESGFLSLEPHGSAPAWASSVTPQHILGSASQQASAQVASTPREPLRASSPHRIAQRDNPRPLSTQQDTPWASSTQRNTQTTSLPSRVTCGVAQNLAHPAKPSSTFLSPQSAQQDNLGTSAQQDSPQTSFPPCTSLQETPRPSCAQRDNSRTFCAQRDNPRTSSPNRATQRDNLKACYTQRDNPRSSSPNRTTQQDNHRTTSPNRANQRDIPRTSCTQRKNPRTSSPNRATQRDNPRTSSPNRTTQRDNPRTSSPNRATQRDIPRSSSPNRATQRDIPRTSSPNRATQRDNPRTSSPNRATQRDIPRTSSPNRATQRDNPRSSSPNRATQRDNPRTSCTQRDNPRSSSPNRATHRDNPRTFCTQRDNPRTSSPNRATQRDIPRSSSPNRATQRDIPRTSSPNRATQRDIPRTSSPNRATQRDIPRSSSPNRATQRDNPRSSSPNRATQRDNPRTSCTQRDNPRSSSPNRATQRDIPRTSSPNRATQRDNPRSSSPNRATHRDNPRTSSPNRATQRDNPRTSCTQRDNPRSSSPNRATHRDNPRTFCTQRDNPRTSSPNRATQQDNPRASCIQRDIPRTFPSQRANPRASYSRWEHLRNTCTRRDTLHSTSLHDSPGTPASQGGILKANPGSSSPCHSTQRNSPRNPSPHRTNKDIPWASFPLRPTHSDGPRTSSPSRSKQNEVPWASIALRPTHSDRPQTSSPSRPAQRNQSQSSSSPAQHISSSRATSSSHNPGHLSASRTSSPPYPVTHGASQISSEPSQPPCAVCIGHRDAPRASSPPRYLQHDPFPFFPEPHTCESESLHHDPPYMPPAVCIGHRDAPWATSPPRHTQFDPFPFLPDTPDAEISESPHYDPPQFPPSVCIGYRDAPRASSPPRQFPEPFLFQEFPRASTESLVPSTDSLHEPRHVPTPVCIGHRDAPSFSSPPRQPPEPSLFFQDLPGTSTESLVPSTDSLHGSPLPPPQVCIGYRDAPRASSPPRHPPSDITLLAPSPPPGSSGGSQGSAAPWETRHNLEREEYTMLADLPPPRRLAQREPGRPAQGSNGGRTRSPGRTEVERLFGQERRKSEAPGSFQDRDEGQSQRPSQGQLHRRQSSPVPSRQMTKLPAKRAEPAQRSRSEPPFPRSPERQPEGNRRLQASSLPPRTSARPPEKELRKERPAERSWTSSRQPLRVWQSQEALSGSQGSHSHLERSWSNQEEGPRPAGCPGLGEPSLGAARTWRGTSGEYRESWGQSEAWEKEPPSIGLQEPSQKPAQRDWGSLQELSSPHQPVGPPENPWAGLAEFAYPQQPEMPAAQGWSAEGACLPLPGSERPPELDWRDLLGLLRAPGEGAWARLPRLDWEGLLKLLQARLPHKDQAKTSGPELIPQGTKDALESEQHSQPKGWMEATQVNGHSPGQQPQSPAPPPSPACTSTQWPKTKVTNELETSTLGVLEEMGHLGISTPAELEFQPQEHEEPEPSEGQDSLTEQKQADSADERPAEGKAGSPLKGRLVTSWRMPGDRPTLFNPFLLSLGVLRWQRPDLLNFKKGWMSILDEPGEWKKHWFVLTDSSLKYYRDSTAEEADELDGEIDLRSCTDVTEYAVQRNYGFQIHTKDAVYTLSAMTSGIRRNWIEALRKTVRPTSAPDVTKLSDCNKENALHGCGTQKGSLKAGEPRGGLRQALDYVELSPLTQSFPQRARAPERLAKQEELERDLAQRSEERRKWFEDSRAPETPAGEGPRRSLGAPLTEDQQSRLSEEIEKKWQELEKLPLRENKRVPLTALLNQSRGERRGPPGDSHEALEKEVQSLRAQLEAWRLRGEAPQNAPRAQEGSHVPPGYISQEACERSLAEMESSHQQVMEQLQQHHERELQRLQQEKEWLLAEETAATASAIEAMKKAYQEELSRELSKTRSVPQGPDGLRKQHQSDVEALKRELQVLSEQYSQKCLEIGALTRQAEEREHTLQRCQQEGQELLRHNQELHARLSEEIDRLRSFIASQGTGNSCGRSQRSSCELEVLLRVKENELLYLKKEVQCLRDELQTMQRDKRFTSGKYQDVYVELNHIKTRSEREIGQLKEHLRLAMAALQEKEATRNSLAE